MEEVIRMLNEESRRKIRELKIDELVDILDDQEHRLDVYAPMSFDDRLSLAIDELYYRKNSKRAKRLISSAKLRYPDADINTLILEPRGLSKPRMIALAAESYLIDARNIIINGYTGVGKTYLSCAIAKEACRRLHKTRYVRMPKMLEEFNLSTQTGSGISKLVKRYSTYHLLIVDEWLVEIPSDVIQYRKENYTVIHRIIEVTEDENGERAFITQGDNNPTPDADPVPAGAVVGKMAFCIPKIGSLSLWLRRS